MVFAATLSRGLLAYRDLYVFLGALVHCSVSIHVFDVEYGYQILKTDMDLVELEVQKTIYDSNLTRYNGVVRESSILLTSYKVLVFAILRDLENYKDTQCIGNIALE